MRLINTSTLELEEFTRDIPSYAILSHTWGDEEVSFQLFQKRQRRSRRGFAKIKRFCALAAREKLEYAWVDTCCIDKSSSAELSEAINSMYSWYQNSRLCMVYLSDMHRRSMIDDKYERSEAEYKVFQACRWFTRGWCLQELLAPPTLIFYDQDWNEIGNKESMKKLISQASGIKASHFIDPDSASVAQKMSWAARRQTTRTEDEAYCLMGLFGVNMPLLYGEGSNAFKRLQQEILKSSNDESIFAWTNEKFWIGGLLANHPHDFANSGDIVQNHHTGLSRAPYMIINQGLQIELLVLECGDYDTGSFESPLRCTREGSGKDTLITLHLIRLEGKNSTTRVTRTGQSSFGLRQVNALKDSVGPFPCYVDEITCKKRPCNTDTDLVWSHFSVSLTIGLRLWELDVVQTSQLYPIDTETVGFYICDLVFSSDIISARYHNGARFYVCWSSKDSSPTSINIYYPNEDQETKSKGQWKDAFNRKDSKKMSVEAGRLLMTCYDDQLFLFITFNLASTLAQTRTTIDIELKRISSSSPIQEFILSRDPRRNDAGYREQVKAWGARQRRKRNPFIGGDKLYGVPVRSLQS